LHFLSLFQTCVYHLQKMKKKKKDAHSDTTTQEMYLYSTDSPLFLSSFLRVVRFRRSLAERGFDAMPRDAACPTTFKRRSRLHGQTYDESKCHVTVSAPKDCIITRASPTPAGSARETSIIAGLSSSGPIECYDLGRALPDSAWASDHCLVMTTVAIEMGK